MAARIAKTFDDFPPEIIVDGELISTRLLADKYEKMQFELGQWRDVGERLYEYVRFFGLFGGDMPAVLAAADLARLLGKDSRAEQAKAIAGQSSAATVEHIANWIVESNWIRRMAPDKREQFLKELRSLAE